MGEKTRFPAACDSPGSTPLGSLRRGHRCSEGFAAPGSGGEHGTTRGAVAGDARSQCNGDRVSQVGMPWLVVDGWLGGGMNRNARSSTVEKDMGIVLLAMMFFCGRISGRLLYGTRCQPFFPSFLSSARLAFPGWTRVVCRNTASHDCKGDFHGNHWDGTHRPMPHSHSPRLGAEKQAFLDVVGKGGKLGPRTLSTPTVDLVAPMHQTVPCVLFLSNFDDVMFGGGLFWGVRHVFYEATWPWVIPNH